jgi:hypothetical protein
MGREMVLDYRSVFGCRNFGVLDKVVDDDVFLDMMDIVFMGQRSKRSSFWKMRECRHSMYHWSLELDALLLSPNDERRQGSAVIDVQSRPYLLDQFHAYTLGHYQDTHTPSSR